MIGLLVLQLLVLISKGEVGSEIWLFNIFSIFYCWHCIIFFLILFLTWRPCDEGVVFDVALLCYLDGSVEGAR